MSTRLLASLVAIAGVTLACSVAPPPTGDPTADPATLNQTCEQAFVAWVELSARLNEPGVDVADVLFRQEVQQRSVFELCSLAEAERLNVEHPVELVSGISRPMIEPDFRTFAEVECVDEAPLLDGTALCAEVGH